MTFFLCLPDEKAEQTAVLATLQACMAAGRQDVTFFVVMGVCPVQANPGADAATLCNYAQIAGVTTDSGYLHRFEPTMLNELKEQQQLLGELERALDNHEFCFFLQPKCNSITRAIVGMEALVRWNHPTRGCVPPAEFMPLLERTGLVTRLDQYIWESVCQTLQKWQESGSNLVPVSVNVSVQDILNLDVPQIFADLVEKYKLEPKLLLAEITETMVAEDTQMVENAIQGLHRKGFSVMMDDFGSGYSSLNMLKDTNVDAIKLDMKLIDMNQENRSKGVQIVESVVDMAHRLNLPIIAEGVETPEQVSMLQAADCLYSQGYYFFKPMPVENAEKLLADPTNQDYWDLRRDLMRRDRRVENPGTEKTALALQAYQIFTDNVLEISLLNLATGAYRVIKRDARLLGADLEKRRRFCQLLRPSGERKDRARGGRRPVLGADRSGSFALCAVPRHRAGVLPLPRERVRPVYLDHHRGAALPGLLRPEPMGDRAGAQRRTGRPAQRGAGLLLQPRYPDRPCQPQPVRSRPAGAAQQRVRIRGVHLH